MKRIPMKHMAVTTLVVAFFILCSCESKEEKAYKIAMHSNNLTEVRNFLRNYEEDASGDEVNNARDEILRLETDSALYAQITVSNVLEERVELEDRYLRLHHPIHEQEIRDLRTKDKEFVKSQEKQARATRRSQQQQASSANEGLGSQLAEAVGQRIGNYLAKREANKYFKNYVFQGNLLGLIELKLVFGPIGSNYTGIAYMVIQTGDWTKFSYALTGNGNMVILLPTGDKGTAKLYSNGIMDDGGNFCEKIYDPTTYQYFFGK